MLKRTIEFMYKSTRCFWCKWIHFMEYLGERRTSRFTLSFLLVRCATFIFKSNRIGFYCWSSQFRWNMTWCSYIDACNQIENWFDALLCEKLFLIFHFFIHFLIWLAVIEIDLENMLSHIRNDLRWLNEFMISHLLVWNFSTDWS